MENINQEEVQGNSQIKNLRKLRTQKSIQGEDQKNESQEEISPKQQLLQQDDEQISPLPIQNNDESSPERNLKRKTTKNDSSVYNKNKLYGLKEDPYNYESQAGEYYNINMEFAISYVFQKSKTLKEKIEQEQIQTSFLNENIINNKHFNLAYNSYLQKLCNKKVLHPEFKNISKKIMNKLENFFIERIDRCVETQRVHEQYQEKAKYIQDCFDKRIQELKEKIKQKNKLGVDD